MTTKDIVKTPYDLLREGIEDLIGVYANVEDTYGFRGKIARLLTRVDTIPTETATAEMNAAKIVAPDTAAAKIVAAGISFGTRVVRVSSSGDDPAPEILIVVSGGFPRAPEGDPDWPSKHMERFRSDASALEEALVTTLPGGTLGQLTSLLLARKASQLVVRDFTVPPETAPTPVSAPIPVPMPEGRQITGPATFPHPARELGAVSFAINRPGAPARMVAIPAGFRGITIGHRISAAGVQDGYHVIELDDELVDHRHAFIGPTAAIAAVGQGPNMAIAIIDLARAGAGTFVNGERIIGAKPLRTGDSIVVGQTKLVIDFENVPAGTPDAEPSAPAPAPVSAPIPVPMLLYCPGCSARHIDEGEFATKIHHTHACQSCGEVWRPAIVPTIGVQFLPGFKNETKTTNAQASTMRGFPYPSKGKLGNVMCPKCGAQSGDDWKQCNGDGACPMPCSPYYHPCGDGEDTGVAAAATPMTAALLQEIRQRHQDADTPRQAIASMADIPELIAEIERLREDLDHERDQRQATVFTWAKEAFGFDQATSLPQRGLRLLEETVEAFQAAGGDPEMAHRLVDYVFARPVGELRKELGGVGVCVLALAAAAGASADEAERIEVERVLGKPLEHFRQRNAEKNAAGFLADVVPPIDL